MYNECHAKYFHKFNLFVRKQKHIFKQIKVACFPLAWLCADISGDISGDLVFLFAKTECLLNDALNCNITSSNQSFVLQCICDLWIEMQFMFCYQLFWTKYVIEQMWQKVHIQNPLYQDSVITEICLSYIRTTV